MTSKSIAGWVLALVAVVALAVWQSARDIFALESWLDSHVLLGAAIYIGLLAGSVVLLPLVV